MNLRAAQHAGCSERSVAARVLEDEFGAWLRAVVALDDKRRTRVAEIVRAKVRRGSDAAKATRIRTAIKRLTDAFTWGAIEEDDYRAQLVDLRTQLAVSEHLPDERRILEATTTAQDIPRAWVLATPEQRRRIVWSTFSLIRVGDGRVTAVRPRPETAPLFAAALTAQPRSRPESSPEQ